MRLGERAKETHAGKVLTPCFKDRGPLFRMTDWWGWGMEDKRRQAAALQEIRHSYLTGIVKELREINRDFALPSKGPEVEVAGFSRKAKRFEKGSHAEGSDLATGRNEFRVWESNTWPEGWIGDRMQGLCT